MQEFKLLMGGRYSPASNGGAFERRNPLNGTVASAAAAAQAAFLAWAEPAPVERRARLLKAADLLEASRPDFIKCGVAETGSRHYPI